MLAQAMVKRKRRDMPGTGAASATARPGPSRIPPGSTTLRGCAGTEMLGITCAFLLLATTRDELARRLSVPRTGRLAGP